MATCILVIKQEKTAYELWEKLKQEATQLANFQVIEPYSKERSETKAITGNDARSLNFQQHISFSRVQG